VARGRPAYGMSSTGGANVYLMNYKLLPDMSSAGDPYSAADGDMDIALALLMAHRQWGSSGTYNYYQEALNTIAALKAADFASNGVMYAPQNVSRVSDYMAGHFRSFKKATNDTFWDNARTNSLTLAQNITANYSSSAKLQPGFIYDPFGTPRPDTVAHIDRSGIEQIYDQNSVRNPWRWATDYIYSGDTGWGNLAKGIVTTLQSSSGGSASGFSYAYNLDGSAVSNLYHEGTTAGCVMAGCMVDASFQTFLNTLFAGNTGSGYKTAYFEAELLLIPLIVVTGNWWRP
jgi:endoglucanase